MTEPAEVAIRTETIELGPFLKLAHAAQTGGDAKALVQAGQVRVNGSVETRRSRDVRPGDEVQVGRFARFAVVAASPNSD